jgi:adenine-specific DNA-methyltransferase
VPAPKESVDFDETQNLFIEGENLEVLKLLYKSYAGRVKMIYIDPPYNTGNDFIYPDDFRDPLDTYLKLTGQKDSEGNLLTSNPETSGRYHSAWLSMMYPRLFIARQLLHEEGVIFVSIDDHEMPDLRLLMNEVFGEENFYATFAWQKKDTPSNDTKGISVTHEYVVAYVRSVEFLRNLIPRTEEQLANYKNPDNDPRGKWIRTALTRKVYVARDYYAIKNPQGRDICPPKGTSWRVSRQTLKRLIEEKRIWWGKDADGDMPFAKRFISEVQQGVVPTTWWDYEFAGSNRNSKMEMRALFDDPPFDTPKPVKLITRMISLATGEEDIILDFFAGSGTTAEAVLALNHADGGNRKFVLMQLPEPTGNKQFPTIADIGKERIRRVIKKLKDDSKGKLDLRDREAPEDLGFRVFKLAESNYRSWKGVENKDGAAYAATMELFTDPLVPGWKPMNVIYEAALKEGYGLTSTIEQVYPQIAPKNKDEKESAQSAKSADRNVVYLVTDADKGQSFRICLDEKMKAATVKALALKKDDLFICRDAALTDEMAANLALQCNLKTI